MPSPESPQGLISWSGEAGYYGSPMETMYGEAAGAGLPARPSRLRLAVAAGKGGVGKTTVACGLASVVAAAGHATLLVDLDPQSNATWGLGGDPTAPGTAELLAGDRAEAQQVAPGLWVLAGGPALRGHEIQRLDGEDLAEQDLLERFDRVIFDCPPGNDHLERLGLVAADRALVVVDAHPFAIQGASRVLSDLTLRRDKGRRGPALWALVMSRLDARRGLDRELDEALAATWPAIPRLRVRQDAALAAASTAREALLLHAPGSRGAEDLRRVAEWLDHGS